MGLAPLPLLRSLVSKLHALLRAFLFWVLSAGPIPTHIAIIMDGNRRFADRLGLDRPTGHSHGYDSLMRTLKDCFDLGVRFLTLYAFSIDNFQRSPAEVSALMELMQSKLETLVEKEELVRNYGVCVRVLGDLSLLPDGVRIAAERAMAVTRCNSSYVLNLCISYTSTNEIVHSIQSIRDKLVCEIGRRDMVVKSDRPSENVVAADACCDVVAGGAPGLRKRVLESQRSDSAARHQALGDCGSFSGLAASLPSIDLRSSGCMGGSVDTPRSMPINGFRLQGEYQSDDMRDGSKFIPINGLRLQEECTHSRSLDLQDASKFIPINGLKLQEECTHSRSLDLQDASKLMPINGLRLQEECTHSQIVDMQDAPKLMSIDGLRLHEDYIHSQSVTCSSRSWKSSNGIVKNQLEEIWLPTTQLEEKSKVESLMSDKERASTPGSCAWKQHYGLDTGVFNLVKDQVTEAEIEHHLYTESCPPPDIVIRTSGETRLSNFLLWQTSFSHLAFCKVLWPEFSFRHLFFIVLEYQRAHLSLLGKQRFATNEMPAH